MPLVSVIVPVYNVAPYLRCCLDSLCAQTLKDIEIICVNDGSTDASPQILEEYASRDKRIRVIHQANGGLSAARNAGLAVVQSPYIGFVDSDDWIAPQTYQVATEIFLQDSELDVVCWGISKWMINNGAWEEKGNWHPVFQEELAVEGKTILSQKIKTGVHMRVCNKLYRTAIIQDKNITFTEKQLYEDNAFWIKYAVWAKTGYFIREPYYYYRIARPGSIMTETKKQPVDTIFLPIFQDMYDYCLSCGIVEKNSVLLSEMLARMIHNGLIYSSDEAAFLKCAREFIESYAHLPDNEAGTLGYLRKGKSFVRFSPLSAMEKILSLTNASAGSKKVFRILGLEFAFDRKRKR